MRIESLSVTNFRNLAQVECTPHPRFNLVVGDNGQGKTNLLEVIYLLGVLKSFRTDKNRQLLGPEGSKAILGADIDRGGQLRHVGLEIQSRGKSVSLNHQLVRNLKDFFGTLNIVKFGPEDVSLLKDSPSERRRFLDRAIFQAHPIYAFEASRYEEVLKQRNAILKSPASDLQLFEVYDAQLVDTGSKLVARRLEFLSFFEEVFVETFRSIFQNDLIPEIRYESSWKNDDASSVAEIEDCLQRCLMRRREEEFSRGFTLSGPHRDDMVLYLNGHRAKDYASQGQHRALVLSLKIAQIKYLQSRYFFEPILLLDDVSSELDSLRNEQLFSFLLEETSGQVFVTSTHRDYIRLSTEFGLFQMREGTLQRPLSNP